MRSYIDICDEFFGRWFGGPTWRNWRVLDKAIFGIPLDGGELETFRTICGSRKPPTAPVKEGWLALGRRAGKDVKAASYVAYLGTVGAELFDYRKKLVPGERAVVQLLAVDREQSQVCFGYIKSFFTEIPAFAAMVKNATRDTLQLTNGVDIEVTTNNSASVRGRSVIAAVLDEVGHWRSETSASPDEDVYRSLKPSMLQFPNAMLIGISSTHMRRGLLWRKVQENYGKDSDVLAAGARDGEFIKSEYAKDPAWAAAEFGSDWRSDLEAFVSLQAIMACVQAGVYERPPQPRQKWVAFCDPSGGVNDSMTLCSAHREADTVVIDAIRERKPPFSPEGVVEEFSDVCRRYRCSRVYGDRFGGEWPREQFQKRGVHYALAEKPKSALYVDFLPLLNSGAVDLLDHETLIAQLAALERHAVRGAGDKVDHPKGGRDDVSNCVAGAAIMAMTKTHPRDHWNHRPMQFETVGKHWSPHDGVRSGSIRRATWAR
jgi:hypothetical protein